MLKTESSKSSKEKPLEFSQPWNISDAVLVVEQERFHVHRSILGMWSPVFSTMFTAQFKEQTADEIPLPGKKASEIKELLLVIYPTSAKQIDESNYLFLLDLAKEYMMTKLTERCEVYLMSCLEKPKGYSHSSSNRDCLNLLSIAQDYELKALERACIDNAKGMRFNDLKNHTMYKKISFSNYRAIVEGRIEKMESEVRDKESKVSQLQNHISRNAKVGAQEALKELEGIISIIAFVACKSNIHTSSGIDGKLDNIRYSGEEFKKLSGPLSNLRYKLQSIEQYCSM